MAVKGSTKGRAAKTKAKAKDVEETVDRTLVDAPPAKIVKQIISMREKDSAKWSEVAAELEISAGKAMFYYMQATCDTIEGTPAKVATAVVKGRDGGESWGLLSARTGRTEGWVKRTYEERSGNSAEESSISKGGRKKGSSSSDSDEPVAKKAAKKPAKKAAAKKAAPAKKAAAKRKGSTPLADMDLEALQERLNGKRILMKDGDKMEITEVTSVADGEMTFTDEDEDTMTIDLSEIKSASR